jgi:pimeloyl-ACP methyl ester carboxylesterase
MVAAIMSTPWKIIIGHRSSGSGQIEDANGEGGMRTCSTSALAAIAFASVVVSCAQAQQARIVQSDTQIDAIDPDIKLFIREKTAEGNTRFTDDNVVLFLHGATAPSTCDFDLSYQDYSWADWMVKRGYVVFMGDYRNYGYSSRERAMDEPPAKNPPVTRSYLALRDIQAMVNHIKTGHGLKKVTLIGWSWGAMMAGYYASLYSDNVSKLVLYAPLYNFNDHTNLGPGSALQNKRKPAEFNFALGAYRLASEAANTARWNGEIPVENKDAYRDPAVPAEYWKECMATDPTSNTRSPLSLRAPNGVLEDSFYQATGRPLWNAANIYAPTLVIGGNYDTWSFIEDREGLMHELVHAPLKKNVLIQDATHFVLFEKKRVEFFEEVLKFLKQ